MRLLLLPFAALIFACGANRVALRPLPERTAPLPERVRAFKELAPESGVQTTFFRNGVQVGTYMNSIMLADGTRVEDPRDLLPAVDEASPTANYIKSFERKANTAAVASTVSYVGMGVGVVVMLLPLVLPRSSSSFDSSPLLLGLGIGGGIMLASLIPLFIAFANGGAAQADRLSAFQSYPRSLMKRLALEESDGPPPEKPAPAEVHRSTDAPLRVSLF